MAADRIKGLAADMFLRAQGNELLRCNDRQHCQYEEYHGQYDGDVEERLLHTPACCEDAARICPGQASQPGTFAL